MTTDDGPFDNSSFDVALACTPDARGHCITCGDEALPARVLRVDALGWTALVEVAGQQAEADISLMEDVRVGEVLLVHGGVALGRERAEQ